MAVNGDVHVLHAPHVLLEVADQVVHLLRGAVAHGVGDVQRGGSGGHGGGVALRQEGPVRPGGVLGGELDVVAEAFGVGHVLPDALEHLLPGHPELVLHVDVAGGDEHMDAGLFGLFQGVPGGIDVLFAAAGEAGHGAFGDRPGDGLHALEVLRGDDGEARLDDVHPQLLQLAGHLHLLGEVHAASRGLLAVPQGGVKNFNAPHRSFLLTIVQSRHRQQKKPPSLLT